MHATLLMQAFTSQPNLPVPPRATEDAADVLAVANPPMTKSRSGALELCARRRVAAVRISRTGSMLNVSCGSRRDRRLCTRGVNPRTRPPLLDLPPGADAEGLPGASHEWSSTHFDSGVHRVLQREVQRDVPGASLSRRSSCSLPPAGTRYGHRRTASTRRATQATPAPSARLCVAAHGYETRGTCGSQLPSNAGSSDSRNRESTTRGRAKGDLL